MSLTKDWKAGKLENGWYYVRNAFLENGTIGKLESKDNCLYCPHSYVFTNNGDTKIIAPVPSYEEYQQLKYLAENGQSAIDTNQRLVKEIEKMKAENKELKHFDGKNVCAENEVLRVKVAELSDLLKESRDILDVEGYYPTVYKINAALADKKVRKNANRSKIIRKKLFSRVYS